MSPIALRYRQFALAFVACLGWLVAARSHAATLRYYVTTSDHSVAGFQQIQPTVLPHGGSVLFNIFYPQDDVYAAIVEFAVAPPFPLVAVVGGGVITGELDVQMAPDAGGSGGPSTWPVVALSSGITPAFSTPGQASPTLYMLDTGITTGHWDLAGTPALTFVPGIAAAYNYVTHLPIPPTPDTASHGTAMASVIGGQSAGLLGPLGINAKVVPVSIYDREATPTPNGWAGTAQSGILQAIEHHRNRRRTQPYLRNHASILCFPHSTASGAYRIGFLDTAMQRAWDVGITVIMSAGNRGILAGKVSPAAADWGYQPATGAAVYPPFTSEPATSSFVRASAAALPLALSPRFLVMGAHSQAGATWASSNANNSSAAVVNLLAPGVGVPAASNTSGALVTGDGTSYATGFGTAAAAWVAYHRPWATPSEIRSALVPTAVPIAPAQPPALALPQASSAAITGITLTYAEWIAHYADAARGTLIGPLANADADPDNDGLANLAEFFSGLDPRFADAAIGPRVSIGPSAIPGTLDVTVIAPRAYYLAAHTTPVLESSSTLAGGSWSAVAIPALLATTPLVQQGDGVEYRSKVTVPATGRMFYRLSYSAP
jgi:Subtilase family